MLKAQRKKATEEGRLIMFEGNVQDPGVLPEGMDLHITIPGDHAGWFKRWAGRRIAVSLFILDEEEADAKNGR